MITAKPRGTPNRPAEIGAMSHHVLALMISGVMAEATSAPERKLEVLGPSRLKASGVVVLRQGSMVVIDVGAPFVVGSYETLPDTLAAGDWAIVTGLPPVHGFLLPKTARNALATVPNEI